MKKKINSKKGKKVVMVSGGFDPVHIGHVRMFEEAKKLGDELVVVLNNDNWLRYKKGFVFMPEADRKEIIESFRSVDRVIITSHEPGTTDITVCHALETVRPHIFVNGGDREKNVPIPEYAVCAKLGIEMVFNVGQGGKIRSSSDFVKKSQKVKVRK
jgi:D-beta-D-heptose 7-phosphate kinase/D-beta-D-heptose 1-phosphate adenosyltransferase